MDAKTKFKLRRVIEALASHRARHTELVTVYIPANYDVVKIQQQLAQEQGTARNIKSATTRKNVIDALEKMIRELKLYKKTPPNGLAIFSGNVAEQEGASDVKVWSVEPPVPLNMKLYRCGQTFFLEPLDEIMVIHEVYGLVVIDRREGNVAILKGKAIIPITEFHSVVPGKYKTGGQSAARFARVRENLAKDFFKKVGAAATEEFRKYPKLKGILLGGPGPTKETFLKGAFLGTEIKEKVIATVDIGYTGREGLDEMVTKAADILAQEEIIEEKKVVTHFFNLLNIRPQLTAYGLEEIRKALELGAIENLLISEKIEREVADALIEKVDETGANWVIISRETREGVQLAEIGGLAATLRFAIGE